MVEDNLHELPKGWAWITIEEVSELVQDGNYGESYPKNHEWVNEGIPFLTAAVLGRNGEIIKSNLKFITPEKQAQLTKAQIRNGDIIFPNRGARDAQTIGLEPLAFLVSSDFQEANINPQLTLVRPNIEIVSPFFLVAALNSPIFLAQFRKVTTGSALRFINLTTTKRMLLPIPPLNEQHRIVKKLEKLLAKVDTCKQRLDKIPNILKRFRQSVLAAACSGRLTADWRENNPDVEPAEELLKRIQKERLKQYDEECAKAKAEGRRKPKKPKEFQLLGTHNFDIPKSWTLAYPEDICSSKNYSIGIGPFGSNLKVSDYMNDGVPLIFVRHIRSGNFAGLEPKYVTPEKAQELLSHMVEPLDLLITKMGEPPGDCEIYPDDRPNGIITSDCLKFRIWETDLERVFFKHCINSFIIKDQLGLITKGVAQQKISVERFKSILFPVPPFAEQQEIVNRVQTLFKLADKIEQRYQKAKNHVDQLTQSILAKAFRGELVPQDPNDEPASVLLERIRAERAKRETETAKKSTGQKGKRRSKKTEPQPSEPIPNSKKKPEIQNIMTQNSPKKGEQQELEFIQLELPLSE